MTNFFYLYIYFQIRCIIFFGCRSCIFKFQIFFFHFRILFFTSFCGEEKQQTHRQALAGAGAVTITLTDKSLTLTSTARCFRTDMESGVLLISPSRGEAGGRGGLQGTQLFVKTCPKPVHENTREALAVLPSPPRLLYVLLTLCFPYVRTHRHI